MLEGDILIWGEFPPNTYTGISISNQTVLHYLHLEKILPLIIEEYSWNKKNLRKVFHYLHLYIKLIRVVLCKKIKIFYFSLPLSVMGSLKFLIVLLVVKILSPQTILKAHIHRGDFRIFIRKYKLNRFIVRCNFQFIDEVIILSKIFIEEILNFSKKVKIIVLHNTSLIEPSKKKINRNYNREFVCISNYIRSKGIQELVECFRSDSLKDHKLTIFGHFYDKSFYRQLKLTASDNISLNGYLDRSNLVRVLDESDCLIMPSWNEGQPVIIIEAMSLGVPVIATGVGDIPDMLGEEYKFIATPRDIESLLECILAYDKSEVKNKISKYLYKRYINKYSNQLYKNKLLEIFS